jgi:hypothetical protein
VTITNLSDRPLETHLIETLDTNGGPAIDFSFDNIPAATDTSPALQFDIKHIFPFPVVSVLNLQPGSVANSSYTVDGKINNPIGTTVLRNQRGDILPGLNSGDGDAPLVRTNILQIDADHGSVGILTPIRHGLPVELIQFSEIPQTIDPIHVDPAHL